MIKTVYLIFKTHLDIGYTDYAENVTKRYLESYIPNAIKVGYALKDTETPFVWTVGSWLVWEALKHDKDGVVEQAIKDGIIVWHALPYTSHTEVMSEKLFSYGLSISAKLDKRFGKKTRAAKMTDVPGHTIGAVPLMAKAGVDFLHIGINTAAAAANVPPLFKWRLFDDEVTVMYQGCYGESQEFSDFAVCFAHTNDNMGPQSPNEIIGIYDKFKAKYPGAKIVAATLDDVAERVAEIKDIPVVTDEIGDNWIHGTGTDPKKVAMYLELLRHIENRDIDDVDLCDDLLLIPEHTWGMCVMKYFPDVLTWAPSQIKAREADEDVMRIERSWQEQRDYVTGAEKTLGYKVDYTVSAPDLTGYKRVEIGDMPFTVSWQLFDYFNDNKRYIEKYMRLTNENYWWALWDYTKFGLPDGYRGFITEAEPVECYEKDGERIYKLAFPSEYARTYGLPSVYAIWRGDFLELRWFGKEKSRLPQAFYLKLNGLYENWKINKMGTLIDPKFARGSKLLHSTTEYVTNGEVEIKALDSVLVLPFGRRLYDFEGGFDIKDDMYFCLYNNQYNTNFPLWYSDDSRFRFEIKKLS